MDFDAETVWLNARKAATEDLLDRVTVYRGGMEAEALAIIEAELRDRGITAGDIDAHERARGDSLVAGGAALQCSFCRKPAVSQRWGWQRLWNKVPLFPRRFRYCVEHRPEQAPVK